MAAGVTPEMREACPTVDGLTRLNFSLTSLENPETPSWSNSDGMARCSNFCDR